MIYPGNIINGMFNMHISIKWLVNNIWILPINSIMYEDCLNIEFNQILANHNPWSSASENYIIYTIYVILYHTVYYSYPMVFSKKRIN